MAKSANSHNRLHCTAELLSELFCLAIEKGQIPKQKKARIKYLTNPETHNWKKEEAIKIRGFGPNRQTKHSIRKIKRNPIYNRNKRTYHIRI